MFGFELLQRIPWCDKDGMAGVKVGDTVIICKAGGHGFDSVGRVVSVPKAKPPLPDEPPCVSFAADDVITVETSCHGSLTMIEFVLDYMRVGRNPYWWARHSHDELRWLSDERCQAINELAYRAPMMRRLMLGLLVLPKPELEGIVTALDTALAPLPYDTSIVDAAIDSCLESIGNGGFTLPAPTQEPTKP